jgi:hypothetical protein
MPLQLIQRPFEHSVDFNDELEACGGCPGQGGTGCGSLAGVPLGSVTCSARQCIVCESSGSEWRTLLICASSSRHTASCEAGFNLHKNRCLTNIQLSEALDQLTFSTDNSTRTIPYPPNLQEKRYVTPPRPGKRDVRFVRITNKSQLRTRPWQQVTILPEFSNPI